MLSDLNLQKARFSNVKFISCKLSALKFFDLDPLLLGFKFENCNLLGCNFSGLQIAKTLFSSCLVHECDFVETNLQNASFAGSDLKGSKFHNCNLRKCNFQEAINLNIDPLNNVIKGALFDSLNALTLLNYLDIVIK